MSFWVFPRIRGLKWFPSNVQKVGGVEIGWKLAHFFKKKKNNEEDFLSPMAKFRYHGDGIVLVSKILIS